MFLSAKNVPGREWPVCNPTRFTTPVGNLPAFAVLDGPTQRGARTLGTPSTAPRK